MMNVFTNDDYFNYFCDTLSKENKFLFLVIHSNPPSGGLGEMITHVSVRNIIEWGPFFFWESGGGGAILYLSVALCFMI